MTYRDAIHELAALNASDSPPSRAAVDACNTKLNGWRKESTLPDRIELAPPCGILCTWYVGNSIKYVRIDRNGEAKQ
jgi:hypothetical protein